MCFTKLKKFFNVNKKQRIIADFDRYLKNTTIFEYKTNNKKGPVFHKNKEYCLIKINGINYFSNQSFFQFIDEIVSTNNIQNDKDYIDKINNIFQFIIQSSKYNGSNLKKDLSSVFSNLKTLLIKIVDCKYNHTDDHNFYNIIGNEKITNNLKGNANIGKIRQTRNLFFEHQEQKKKFKGNDFKRSVSFLGGGDNTVGRINMKIFIKNENKEYEFSLCPLLDFCVFIDELIKSL